MLQHDDTEEAYNICHMQGPHIMYTEWGKKYGKVYKVLSLVSSPCTCHRTSSKMRVQHVLDVMGCWLSQCLGLRSTCLERSRWWSSMTRSSPGLFLLTLLILLFQSTV